MRRAVCWADGQPTRVGHHRGIYRGVELLVLLSPANGCRVEFLGRELRTTAAGSLRKARMSLAQLLRDVRDIIDGEIMRQEIA